MSYALGMTTKTRIEQAATANGWTSKSIAYEYIEYRRKSKSVCVYYSVREAVQSASFTFSTRSGNILGTGKAERVLGILEG